jgi:hypothetical protein
VKKVFVIGLLVIVVLTLSACAASPNQFADPQNVEGTAAGFWLGLWHGFIAPVTFIISLFNKNVGVYEVFNNGGWYNFGFLAGASMIFGGGGGGACASSRRK